MTKKVSKKKGNLTSLHENSRDSQSLRRAAARDDKVARATALRAKVNQPYRKLISAFLPEVLCRCAASKALLVFKSLPCTVQRVAYLQGAASAVSEPIDITEVQRLVER